MRYNKNGLREFRISYQDEVPQLIWKQRPLYLLQFDGDLPRTRNLTKPELFSSLSAALERIERLFFIESYCPDPEDDRILLWKLNPPGKASVVWAFTGWHWDPSDPRLPGLARANDVLPSSGMSLYQACMDEDDTGYRAEMERKTRARWQSDPPVTAPAPPDATSQLQKKKRRQRKSRQVRCTK